ncbi:MAG TPA: serine/threonine-protein kinase [Streptosporangiaceae bacterium]|nr:serine/threonine-protein kinase [Streptosporangiaceae bacterium]
MPQPALMEPLRRWDPEQVGSYVLLGRLGSGAMGQVYLARSPAGRLVAVKTIKTELAEEPDFRTRFGQEVAAARRVSGAFTAAVVAADSEADIPWLATVYVPAPSLSRLVRSCGPLPTAAVCWLAAGCAEALEAIHGVGLVHRDLKPSNVLVSPDGPRVIDFGVARAAERIQLTVTRGSIGTPAYMAPEQARDTRQATPASDVFSLGATMLFAATGHAPYQGETVMDVLVRLATQAPDLTGLPDELRDLVTACLERDPRNRPSSASIVARLAPELAASEELGSAPLPAAALALIAEYRRAPAEAAADVADTGEETTLGSQPLPGGRGASLPGPASALRHTATRHGAAVTRSAPGAAADRRVPARPRNLRVLLAGAAVILAAALVSAGWAVGRSLDHNGRPVTLGPILQPPPDNGSGPPGGPGSALADTTPGTAAIGVSQPTGDPDTVFVVHGQGWPVGKHLTITLVGVGTSPIHPVADGAGMFNYAINQDHEFFPGGLPPGIYTVRVTVPGGQSAEARFEVTAAP